jgi:lysozyme
MTLEDQLVRDEGEVLHAYQDSLGFWTIGVGHLIDARKGGSIPKEVSRALLQYDIDRIQGFVRTHFLWSLSLDEVRLAAFTNMAFNLEGNLDGFVNFLAKMKAGDWAGAAVAGRDSLWHKQVGDRAERIMRQIETGAWT